MKQILIVFALLSYMICNAQTFSSTTEVDFFGNEVTTYVDEFGFEIGSKIETTDLFGNVQTSYQDEFGFEVGTSTGYYNYNGDYNVEFDFDTYTGPSLDLELPRLNLELPKFNPDNN